MPLSILLRLFLRLVYLSSPSCLDLSCACGSSSLAFCLFSLLAFWLFALLAFWLFSLLVLLQCSLFLLWPGRWRLTKHTLTLSVLFFNQPLQVHHELAHRIITPARRVTPEINVSFAVRIIVARSVHQRIARREALQCVGGVAPDVCASLPLARGLCGVVIGVVDVTGGCEV